jgi:hypothetical protein
MKVIKTTTAADSNVTKVEIFQELPEKRREDGAD